MMLVLVKGNIDIIRHDVIQVAFENCALFIKFITTDRATIDEAEDLDLVMSLNDLWEYSLNYSDRTGKVWFYSKDEATNFNVDIADDNTFKSFI